MGAAAATRSLTWAVRAVLASGGAWAVVVVASSFADADHSLWRDPLSYFGAGAAPSAPAYAISLAVTGAAVAWLGVCLRPWPAAHLIVASGVTAILLAALPIDCSPVDDACEVVVRAGADSVSHDLHGYVGVVFHLLVGAVIVRLSAERRPLFVAVGLSLVGVLPLVALLVRPFEPGVGAAQVVSLLVAAVLVVRGPLRGVTGVT